MNFDTSTNDYGAATRGPAWVLEYTLNMGWSARPLTVVRQCGHRGLLALRLLRVHDGDMSPVYSRTIVCTDAPQVIPAGSLGRPGSIEAPSPSRESQ
jgi:hypothetical protein